MAKLLLLRPSGHSQARVFSELQTKMCENISKFVRLEEAPTFVLIFSLITCSDVYSSKQIFSCCSEDNIIFGNGKAEAFFVSEVSLLPEPVSYLQIERFFEKMKWSKTTAARTVKTFGVKPL